MSQGQPRLLVFDLDGTLIDSRIDLTNSVNATLTHFARPTLPPEVIAGYIGDGAGTLVRRAFAHAAPGSLNPGLDDESLASEALDWFLEFYRIHKLDATTVYPGVLGALTALRDRHPHLPMAVLTNKPVNPSREICDALGLAPFFFQNYGGNSFSTKKPHPEGLLALIHEASVIPGETVMIGDSHTDIETARAAGTRSLGCLYGLSPDTLRAAHPDHLVQTAADWPGVLGL